MAVGVAQPCIEAWLLAERCPRGFAPFAEEVRHYIRPLFDEGAS
jgi:hypothetical protein